MAREMIVAYGKHREIGARGDLPWGRDLPADLRYFRELTLGKTVIMGHATYLSIGRPLPSRQNIVVTSRPLETTALTVPTLDAAYQNADSCPIIIGGAMMYASALETIDRLHATEIHATFPGSDTFFPELPDSFYELTRISHSADEDNRYDFDFVTYQR